RFLVVWNGEQGDGPGGTADSYRRWTDAGHNVEIIDMAQIFREGHLPDVHDLDPAASPPPENVMVNSGQQGSTVMALLFADVVGFSKLREEHLPRFVDEFLG